jgi:hypothetical protein
MGRPWLSALTDAGRVKKIVASRWTLIQCLRLEPIHGPALPWAQPMDRGPIPRYFSLENNLNNLENSRTLEIFGKTPMIFSKIIF